VRDSWTGRTARARELAEADAAARSILNSYAGLLDLQRDCAERLHTGAGWLAGSLDRDLSLVRQCVPRVLSALASVAPASLAADARGLLGEGDAAMDSMLLNEWRTPSGQSFFAKLVLQPYASALAAAGVRPEDRAARGGDNCCPFCGGAPQLSLLHSASDADGGGRQLQCALCFTVWPFRRVLCAHCGEEDEHRLGYFHSPAFDHVRVDVCETCRHYVKTIDLTRLGLAVPVVDEVATASLDLWARDRGYEKIELNLIGL
jgi:FdhE protein